MIYKDSSRPSLDAFVTKKSIIHYLISNDFSIISSQRLLVAEQVCTRAPQANFEFIHGL